MALAITLEHGCIIGCGSTEWRSKHSGIKMSQKS
jgi:hypothetical protein